MKPNLKQGILILAVILAQLACSSQDAHKVASALHDVTVSIGALQTTIIQANQAGLIPDRDAVAIIQVCVKVQQGEIQANQLTRQYTALPADTKPKLAQIIAPILDAVNGALTSGLAGIKDPKTLQLAQQYLQTAKSGLLIVQAITG